VFLVGCYDVVNGKFITSASDYVNDTVMDGVEKTALICASFSKILDKMKINYVVLASYLTPILDVIKAENKAKLNYSNAVC